MRPPIAFLISVLGIQTHHGKPSALYPSGAHYSFLFWLPPSPRCSVFVNGMVIHAAAILFSIRSRDLSEHLIIKVYTEQLSVCRELYTAQSEGPWGVVPGNSFPNDALCRICNLKNESKDTGTWPAFHAVINNRSNVSSCRITQGSPKAMPLRLAGFRSTLSVPRSRNILENVWLHLFEHLK